MNKILSGSLFVLGVSSLISQVLLIREFATSFYGNELFIGWILFAWLFWSGIGSFWGGKSPGGKVSSCDRVGICQGLVALLLPFEILAARASRVFLGQMPGAIPDLVPSLIYSFLSLAPFCILLGLQFSFAVRAAVEGPEELRTGQRVGQAYLAETWGFVIGGVLFSFLWVLLDVFATVTLVIWMNLGMAVLFLAHQKRRHVWIWLVACVLVVGSLVLNLGTLELRTAQFRFPSEKLKRFVNSVHGNIAVTQRGTQHNFYQNGVLLGTERDTLASEYLVHLPMLAHPNPQEVLLLGTGFNGPLQEILKHGPAAVHEVELDPVLSGEVLKYLPPDLQETLQDPRVRTWTADPRTFLRVYGRKFDVIIANLPDPTSILINRNDTQEFFRSVQAHLRPGGLFAMRLGFAPDYVTPELQRLGGSVFATLKDVFSSVMVLPEDTIYYLAMTKGAEVPDPEKMVRRMRARHITPAFLTESQIRYRFTNDRVDQVSSLFENMLWKVKNTDARPRSYYFSFLRWLSQFHPEAAQAFFDFAQVPSAVLFVACLLCVALPLSFSKDPQGKRRQLALYSMGTVGFSLMAFEILVIYLFQVAFGNLYYRLALLLAAFMAGSGVGAWMTLRLSKGSGRLVLVGIHILGAGYFLLLMHGCRFVFDKGFLLQDWHQIVFGIMAAFGGLFAGAGFPCANSFYLSEGKGERLGSVYAADLLGASVGALLTAGFLVPVWGVVQTLILLSALNILVALFLLFRKDLGRKDV